MPRAKAKAKYSKQVKLSLVGIQYRVTPAARKMMRAHLPIRVRFEREPTNPNDPNAIKVVISDPAIPYHEFHIGYLKRQVAQAWAPQIDLGSLTLGKSYLIELDHVESTGQLLIEVEGKRKSLEIARNLDSQKSS
jgi:HIRAN domain